MCFQKQAKDELQEREWFRNRFIAWAKQVGRGDIPQSEVTLILEVLLGALNELKTYQEA